MSDVALIPFDEIDKVQWNSCVHYAANGNIFGYHWYLTNVVRSWDALVYNDYEMVFPLISRSAFPGFEELYQPTLLGKLGVFSINMPSTEKVNMMLEAIPSKYREIDVSLNELNRMEHSSTPVKFSREVDHSLHLEPNYEQIRAGYTSRMNELLSGEEDQWYFNNNMSPEKFVNKMMLYSPATFDRHQAHRIIYNGMHRGIAFLFILTNKDEQFLGGCLLLLSHGRLFHILSGYHPDFDRAEPRAILWDGIIRTYSDRPLILDFNMPGASFPVEFGAREYDFFRLEKSPAWLQWGKKWRNWF